MSGWAKHGKKARRSSGKGKTHANQGNRGKVFEKYLDGLHRGYVEDGAACVTRNHFEVRQRGPTNANGTFLASYGEPAAVDYSLVAGGYHLYMDAKESAAARFPWDKLHTHQGLYLDEVLAQSTRSIAGLLIHQSTRNAAYFVPWCAIRSDWHFWHDNHLKNAERKKAGQAPLPIKRGRGSITWEDLAERAIYSGNTTGYNIADGGMLHANGLLTCPLNRFDYLVPVQDWADDTLEVRLEAHRQLVRLARQERRRRLGGMR